MARRRRERMSEGKKNIIAGLIQEYDIKTAEDIQEALKDLLGGTIQEMMEAELDEHLGYDEYERSDNPDYLKRLKKFSFVYMKKDIFIKVKELLTGILYKEQL